MAYTGKLVIATPMRSGEGHAEYIYSMVQTSKLLERWGVTFDYWAVPGDLYIDRVRNTICTRFLEGDATDLIFVDADQSWNPVGLARLLVYEDEIVGGSYPMKNDWGRWTATLEKDRFGRNIRKDVHEGHYLLKAQMLPTGFMRIKRTALERFANAYPGRIYQCPGADPEAPGRVYVDFFECARDNLIRYGEDGYFCKLWRDIGGELWVDPDITLGHHGVKKWEGNLHETLLAQKASIIEIAMKGAA